MIGDRLPVSFYREIVFGLRTDPYLAVQRPEHRDHPVRPDAWSWSDTVASWTWDIPEATLVVAEAYADADEIAFLLNGTEVGRTQVGDELPFYASAEVPYHAGVFEGVAFKAGAEVGRCALNSSGPAVRIGATTDRETLSRNSQDVLFIEISLLDEAGELQTAADRTISVRVAGAAVLEGVGSARRATQESFIAPECTTDNGRALAVVRYSPGHDKSADTEVLVEITARDLPTSKVSFGLLSE